MLRSNELLGAHRDELFDLDGEHPRLDVPLRRVKKKTHDPAAAIEPRGGDHQGGLEKQ
jgi:hypothetical protein